MWGKGLGGEGLVWGGTGAGRGWCGEGLVWGGTGVGRGWCGEGLGTRLSTI